MKYESVANKELVLQRPQKGVRGESLGKLFAICVCCHVRAVFFYSRITESMVCCQCSTKNYFHREALHIVIKQTGQGGYRQKCISFTGLILTTP